MAATTVPCAHCGAVFPLAQMVTVNTEGEYVDLCPPCARHAATGKGPEGASSSRRRR